MKKEEAAWTDKAARQIGQGILQWQRRLSDRASRAINRLPVQGRIGLLAALCAAGGGWSGWLVLSVFRQPAFPVRQEAIRLPLLSEEPEVGVAVDSTTIQAIREYQRRMDSAGIPIAPSLLDSMKTLEQIYSSQQNQ